MSPAARAAPTQPIRVLLVEDNPGDARLIFEMLAELPAEDFDLERVDRLASALERLSKAGVDVVLLDLGLPDSEGLETFARAHREAPLEPIVVISGLDDERVALEAVRAGAEDYLVKGRIEGPLLARVIRYAIERKRVQEELRRSETRLQAIIDAALDAVITMDGEGMIQGWSTQAERIFGWPAEDAVGRPLADTIIPPRYRDAHRRGLARFLESGEGPLLNQRIEITGLRRDGREIPVELAITPVRLGGEWLFSAFLRDISERQRVDRRRAAQYAVTRLLAEAATVGAAGSGILRAIGESLDWQIGLLWMLDREGDMLRCVDLWHAAGVAPGEFGRVSLATTFSRGTGLPGRVWASGGPIWHHDVAAVAPPDYPRLPYAVAAGVRGTFAFPIRSATGITGVIEFASYEPREPDPDLIEMTAAVGSQLGEFIERKAAEEALRRSEERHRLLFDAGPHPMWVYDLDTLRFLTVNDAALRHYGYARDEFLAMTVADIRPLADAPGREPSVDVRAGESDRVSVGRHRKKDGTLIDVEVVRYTLQFEGKRAALVLAQDVTQRVQLEEQLRQAQKMEAVGRLAGGVAHDFNNLLTAIFGYADLILEELPATSPVYRDLQEIRKAAERASALTRQLLAFSRQQVLEPQVVSLNDLVEDIHKMARRLLGEDVELRHHLSPDAGNVRADPGQLQQVIMNLAVNARDAMPTGGKLLIETANADLTEQYTDLHKPVTPGRYVMLAVSDTGTGMTAETKARIFEPFFTTKERGKGTGLGLSTVYGIVKQSGGYIWAYSELGRGTTFKIYLPRVDAPVEPLAPPHEAETLSGTETILLAEDDDMLRPLAKGLLEKLGYTVLAAENAERALILARTHPAPLHLLIADVVMPGESGRELARRLVASRPDVRVLYVSGYTDDAIVHHSMLEPGLNFLQKPFTPAALARKVREVLDAQ